MIMAFHNDLLVSRRLLFVMKTFVDQTNPLKCQNYPVKMYCVTAEQYVSNNWLD